MLPPFSPAEIVAVLLAEFLFGVGFNILADWAQKNKVWHVSISVVIGVAVTLAIPTGVWMNAVLAFWQSGALLFACFMASGIPMIVGSTRRSVAESHKRRPWPNGAAQARDNAVMDLNILADAVAEKKLDGAQVVNHLHRIIGILKSV